MSHRQPAPACYRIKHEVGDLAVHRGDTVPGNLRVVADAQVAAALAPHYALLVAAAGSGAASLRACSTGIQEHRDRGAGGIDGALAVALLAKWREASPNLLSRHALSVPEDHARESVRGAAEAVLTRRVVRQQTHPGPDIRGSRVHRRRPWIAITYIGEEPRPDLLRAIQLEVAYPANQTTREREQHST
jgi:hypothetical protein